MKKKKTFALAFGLLLAVLALAYTGRPLRNSVTLVWTYPANEMTNASLVFYVYASSDIQTPLTNWQVFTNVPGTNLSVTVPLAPANMFFFLTASNFWGEGPPSNVASTPPPPRSGSLSVQ